MAEETGLADPNDVQSAPGDSEFVLPVNEQGDEIDLASALARNIQQFGGEPQSAVDVADRIDQIFGALSSQGNDSMLVDSNNALDVSAATVTITDDGNLAIASLPEPLDVSGAEVDVDIASQTASPLAVAGTVDVSAYNGGTLPTEQQSPVGVEDSTGTQINPDQSPEYPDNQTVGHDLDADGDLTIGPVSVARSEAVVIAITSTDGANFSASVEWTDGSGNTFQSEAATDIGIDATSEEWVRLVRKGPQVTVTVTDTSGGTNNVNAHVDTER